MENSYLIPANTKKSQYILGFFTVTDLIIVISGWIVTFAMILIIGLPSAFVSILILLPGLIASFLVMPVPHYHNVLQLIINIFNFFTNRRRYYWKGWDIYEEFNGNDK